MNKKIWTAVLGGAVLVGLLGTLAHASDDNSSVDYGGINPAAVGKPVIVWFAMNRVGERVGRGECTDLIDEAFRVMGFTPHVNIPRDGKIDTYSWGTRVRGYGRYTRFARPKAGHVIQFEDCYFDNGQGTTAYMPHHTAIVESANGLKVTLLHQNLDGSLEKSVVRRTELDLGTKTKGYFVIYAPVRQAQA